MPDREPTRQWRDLEDAELVELYRDRSIGAAFDELIRRYQTRLYRILLGMVGEPVAAEELCQQSFVKAALRLDQLREPAAFYGWLIRIAKTLTIDQARKDQQRQHNPLDEQVDESGPDTAAALEIREAVHQVLARLSEEDRLVLLLAELESLSITEIATALNIKQSAAKMRVKRARDRFRALYGELT